jgi:hypothetical protein
MEKTYHLIDGGVITAANPHDFVTALREGSKFDNEPPNEAYMLRFAERYKIQTGAEVSTASEEAFFNDLLEAGYMQ